MYLGRKTGGEGKGWDRLSGDRLSLWMSAESTEYMMRSNFSIQHLSRLEIELMRHSVIIPSRTS